MKRGRSGYLRLPCVGMRRPFVGTHPSSSSLNWKALYGGTSPLHSDLRRIQRVVWGGTKRLYEYIYIYMYICIYI